ncbi:hypothetical protein LTR56_001814 [Elasticomyces elasticus]|nr:hypothetical protein LTR56_001814 [Elasticomyces elasticus]KAK3668835.1 hypothetical protein LTR22_000315 [Elasticomyces elasticus]KAK4924952.1 hypothetical protein LTR49_007958 [Elasticomyces elasticus]KAK5763208.1 hypothetical protein LTS12_006592 [Elasticomyces elasticus]
MRIFLFRALWLSSVVTAELVTITKWATCPTFAAFTVPSYNSTISTPPAAPSSSSSSLTIASASSSATVPSASARPTGLGSLGPGAAASSVQQKNKVDFLFWLEFADAIRTAAEIQPSNNTAIFIGRTAQTGPLAGDNIADGYTNQGIFQLANNLLNDTSIFYAPSADYGYIDALSNYLDYVDLEVKPTAKQENDLLNWEMDLTAAHAKTVREKAAAKLDYLDDLDLEVIPDSTTFMQWLENGNGQL